MTDFNHENHERYLRNYYQHFYPIDLLIKWLAYDGEREKENDNLLPNREFAFIMKDDFHLRFLSFKNVAEFRESLLKFNPHKIDIGAIYNRPPRDRKKVGDFFPCERELVFDIDLTDYDVVRNCCRDANICQKCWRWITVAVKVLELLLRNHFGFKHLLWVFSGRRGIHCWVTDRSARQLPNKAREALVKYLIFDKKSQVINKYRVHPMAEHAYRAIMDSGEFDKLVLEQGWLDGRNQWTHILALCPDLEVRKLLDTEFESLPNAELRWNSLKLRFDAAERAAAIGRGERIPPATNELAKNFLRLFVLEYAYPKLDEKVTTGMNHLLKAPFTVHPKTGVVAIPVEASKIAQLRLDELPRVDKLMSGGGGQQQEGENMEIDKQKGQQAASFSSLSPYIDVFEKFIININNA